MVSLKNILNIDISYPGIGIKVELIVLKNYLSQMETGINSVCEGYIAQEMKNYNDSEFYEYQHVYQIAEEEMPRIIRTPFVVTIYSLFENSVIRLLDYARNKECKKLSLRDINCKSPMSGYNKYMDAVLDYKYSFSQSHMKHIKNLSKIRNFIAHGNGNISLLDEEKRKDLDKLCKEYEGLNINSDHIDVSCKYLEYAIESVELALKDLMDYMESRYKFN